MKIFSRAADHLDHLIGPGLLEVAIENTEAIEQAQYPKTQTGMRSFLGMCNVHRRFVLHFARVASPLNRHTAKVKGKDMLEPSDDELVPMNHLKKALFSPRFSSYLIPTMVSV